MVYLRDREIDWIRFSNGWPELEPELGARQSAQVSQAGDQTSIEGAIICHLPRSALVGSWSQELELGIKPRHSPLKGECLNS